MCCFLWEGSSSPEQITASTTIFESVVQSVYYTDYGDSEHGADLNGNTK